MIYRIENWEQAIAFENWAEANHIPFEKLDEGNYVDTCPHCGEYEHFHDGHCGNCGFDV